MNYDTHTRPHRLTASMASSCTRTPRSRIFLKDNVLDEYFQMHSNWNKKMIIISI